MLITYAPAISAYIQAKEDLEGLFKESPLGEAQKTKRTQV